MANTIQANQQHPQTLTLFCDYLERHSHCKILNGAEKIKSSNTYWQLLIFTVLLPLTFLVEQQTSTRVFCPFVHTVALLHLLEKQMFFSWVFQP